MLSFRKQVSGWFRSVSVCPQWNHIHLPMSQWSDMQVSQYVGRLSKSEAFYKRFGWLTCWWLLLSYPRWVFVFGRNHRVVGSSALSAAHGTDVMVMFVELWFTNKRKRSLLESLAPTTCKLARDDLAKFVYEWMLLDKTNRYEYTYVWIRFDAEEEFGA